MMAAGRPLSQLITTHCFGNTDHHPHILPPAARVAVRNICFEYAPLDLLYSIGPRSSPLPSLHTRQGGGEEHLL